MKKLIALILVFVLAFSICACSSDSKKDADKDDVKSEKTTEVTSEVEKIPVEVTGITISSYQELLRGHDPSLTFTTTEEKQGIQFQYKDNTENMEMKYAGIADSEENVHYIEITHYDIDSSIITDRALIEEIWNAESLYDYDTDEIKTLFIYYNMGYLFASLGYSPRNTEQILDIICDGETFEIDGWKFEAAPQNDDFMISLAYKGE